MEIDMDILDVMEKRHSVRDYADKKIEEEKRQVINDLCALCEKSSGLNIIPVYDEETAFEKSLMTYGKIKGVKNYIAFFGDKDMDEKVGYFGEKIVLRAQEIGLNTCWVALTFNKAKVLPLKSDKKLYVVIALGYGNNQGVPHRNKDIDKIVEINGEKPLFFDRGVRACMLAPTAINQQRFKIILNDGKVDIVKTGIGFYGDMDLGIVKCHYEFATGQKITNW